MPRLESPQWTGVCVFVSVVYSMDLSTLPIRPSFGWSVFAMKFYFYNLVIYIVCRLRKLSSLPQVAANLPTLPALIPFLEVSQDQEYIVSRIKVSLTKE